LYLALQLAFYTTTGRRALSGSASTALPSGAELYLPDELIEIGFLDFQVNSQLTNCMNFARVVCRHNHFQLA